MRHLHLEYLVHRDIAARNILLSKDFEPKITDFGMSRVLESLESLNSTTSNLGPLRHMAPECLIHKQYGISSDVWSFGVLLYEILTASVPYAGLTSEYFTNLFV